MTLIRARGPYFDELQRGQIFSTAPGVTLSDGGAAAHQAIVGDRLNLSSDWHLSRSVSGGGVLAHPAYVWDVAIGQSTVATHYVRANLFYRGLIFHRFPVLGDTLRSTTKVVGLKQNSTKAGKPRTGLAALHIITRDQNGQVVLDFFRCAMLPLGPGAPDTGHADELSIIGQQTADHTGALAGLQLTALPHPHSPALRPGDVIDVVGGDVVSSAPELARASLNIAQVHHDWQAGGGQRLVYGGHSIGIAAAQITRALPNIVTFLGWESCDHTGPVFEGDTLHSTVTVEGTEPYAPNLSIVSLRCLVDSVPVHSPAAELPAPAPRGVLDWRLKALLFTGR